jgi:hypothetical protein
MVAAAVVIVFCYRRRNHRMNGASSDKSTKGMIQLVDHDTITLNDADEIAPTTTGTAIATGSSRGNSNDRVLVSTHDDPGDDSDMNYLPHQRLRGSEQSDIDSSDIDSHHIDDTA